MYFANKIMSLSHSKAIVKTIIIVIGLISICGGIFVTFSDGKSNILKTSEYIKESQRGEPRLAELQSALSDSNKHAILSLQDIGLIISLLDKSDTTLTTEFNVGKQLFVLSISKSVSFSKIQRFFNFSCLFSLDKKVELVSCYTTDFEISWHIVKSFLFLFYGADFLEKIDSFVSNNTVVDDYIIYPAKTEQSVAKAYIDKDRKETLKTRASEFATEQKEDENFQTKLAEVLAPEPAMEQVNILHPNSKKTLFDLPLVGIEKFKYRGGFRLSSKTFGADAASSVDFSYGQFTYNPKNHSIFIIGHPKASAVAEFKIPEIVDSTNIADFEIADQLIQPFTRFYKTARVDTGIKAHFRVTGMELINDGLMVNYINWYDANGAETDTSIYFKDASNLATSVINGPYQVNGAAHAAGFISAIPPEWQGILGGTHISGSQSGASITSRLSNGPAAFAINPSETFIRHISGALDSIKLLDFPLSNILYDKSVYTEDTYRDNILKNFDGNNDLWTIISGAAYGFIVPNTRTYVTLGRSGGHKSGIGYKILQDDGTLCGGSCAKSASDYASYYWLWDVKELVKVKLGLQNSFDVRPYAYGEFVTPMDMKKAGINSGYFDPVSALLYLSIPHGDLSGAYARPPLMLVYEFVGE